MDFYKLFYWMTVADSVKHALDIFSNWFLFFSIIFGIIAGFMTAYNLDSDRERESEETKVSNRYWYTWSRRTAIFFFIMTFITWMAWAFMPSKRDAVIILAGGTIGNFIQNDSNARQIPSEAMNLIKTKLRTEIKELEIQDLTGAFKEDSDTLKSMSKEQLIELVKSQSAK